jgi:hypothetical protein
MLAPMPKNRTAAVSMATIRRRPSRHLSLPKGDTGYPRPWCLVGGNLHPGSVLDCPILEHRNPPCRTVRFMLLFVALQ